MVTLTNDKIIGFEWTDTLPLILDQCSAFANRENDVIVVMLWMMDMASVGKLLCPY